MKHLLIIALALFGSVDRWQGFDAQTASNPNCSVAPETWTSRDENGKVTSTERKYRLNVKWDAVEDGALVHHTFWWSLEPNRRKAFYRVC